MIEEATLDISPQDLVNSQNPYTPHFVDRSTVFTYNSGSKIYELVTPTGQRYVMQSWSQQIDPSLRRSQLSTLGARLSLPSGWHYVTRTLTKTLKVSTLAHDAAVLQDSFDDSYSLES